MDSRGQIDVNMKLTSTESVSMKSELLCLSMCLSVCLSVCPSSTTTPRLNNTLVVKIIILYVDM